MNSKDKKKKDIDLETIMQEAIEFKSEEEKLELDTELLHLNFMHIIEGIMKDKKINLVN